MRWRRQGSDGFEWHKHVRTTIKLRREGRRRRIDLAKAGAAARAKSLQLSLAEGAKRSSAAIGDACKRFASASRTYAGQGASAARSAAVAGSSRTWQAFQDHVLPAIDRLPKGTPGVATVIAGIATLSLLAKLVIDPLSLWAIFGLLICGAVTAGAAALWIRGDEHGDIERLEWPKIRLENSTSRALAAAVAILVIGVGASTFIQFAPSQATIGSLGSLTLDRTDEIKGRATALRGDLLRINGTTVKLSGIAAPELIQRCRRSNGRRWRCGRSARTALRRLIARQTVSCDVDSTDDRGIKLATCFVGKTDLASRLVSQGHVFAAGGLLASHYSSETAEAQSEKRGIWRGTAERPSEFRKAVWDRALRNAPNGCPIKGRRRDDQGVYVVPWSPRYRRTRVRTRRGDRWFCSEEEARSAGWKPDMAG